MLKRDAVAKVVLNNLYKHTQLQTTFGANMLRWSTRCRARSRWTGSSATGWTTRWRSSSGGRSTGLGKAEERIHILRGYLKALDALDDVIALIRASQTVEGRGTA